MAAVRHDTKPNMRQLHVDREDDPAPSIRILDTQEHGARPALQIYIGGRKGTAIAGLWEKALVKHYAIRRHHLLCDQLY